MRGSTVNVIFLTATLPVATREFETTRPVELDMAGNRRTGIGRVTEGSVNGITHQEVHARSLLSDLYQQAEEKKRTLASA
jgi:hypothetical protein